MSCFPMPSPTTPSSATFIEPSYQVPGIQVLPASMLPVSPHSVFSPMSSEASTPHHEPILRAVAQGDVASVQRLLDSDSDLLRARGPRMRTPLIVAAAQGHVGVVTLLLQRGVPLTDVDADGCSALSHAAAYGRADVVDVLLSHGMSAEYQDNVGYTPLMAAVSNGHRGAVRRILHHVPDRRDMKRLANITTVSGETALWCACFHDEVELVNVLLLVGSAFTEPRKIATRLNRGRCVEAIDNYYAKMVQRAQAARGNAAPGAPLPPSTGHQPPQPSGPQPTASYPAPPPPQHPPVAGGQPLAPPYITISMPMAPQGYAQPQGGGMPNYHPHPEVPPSAPAYMNNPDNSVPCYMNNPDSSAPVGGIMMTNLPPMVLPHTGQAMPPSASTWHV